MKKIIYTLLSVLMIGLSSCNETSWLKEKPLDFFTPENAYQTTQQFRQALNFEYDAVRRLMWSLGDQGAAVRFGDLSFGGTDYPDGKFNNWKTFITPETYVAGSYWNPAYLSIGNANTILNRIRQENKVSEADKKQIEGEARFFRAFWYKLLADFFGGVPIELNEVTEPRTDYVRATRDEVYNQCRTDLEAAINLLASIDDSTIKDGMISKQVAQHVLAEVCISLKEYTAAIDAATAVISYPAMDLMKTRFGTRKDHTPGDPYWDLFQADNQNRSTGNKEALLVLQYDYQSTGSTYSYEMPRWILPYYFGPILVEGKTGGFVNPFPWFTSEKGGRGIGVNHPTDYFLNDIWGSDGDKDYRNSPYMIVRDFKIENPNALHYGEWFVAGGYLKEADKIRNFYPFIMKFSRVGDFPEASHQFNADGSKALTPLGEHILINSNNSANWSFKDEYLYRLAGTYLLRAEAYVMAANPQKAADDLNVLRARANATLCQASEVDINYIMDEQLRELYFEDMRVQTLYRMNKFVERTKAYNPTGYNVADYQSLFPIPYSEIERNRKNKLEQNLGYE